MALTVGSYVWPGHEHAVAVAAVVALTAVNYVGVHKSALLTRVIVAVVLAVLAAVVAVCLTTDAADVAHLDIGADASFAGVLQAAGLLFFAFAGYARIATLGEEVRDPDRTIPRAIRSRLGITLVVYVGRRLRPAGSRPRPAGPHHRPTGRGRSGGKRSGPGPCRAGRRGGRRARLTARADPGGLAHHSAMARDRHLLHVLAVVHPRFQVPHRAELAVGAVVAVLAATTDVRGAIGFLFRRVLVYDAVANVSAWTLSAAEGRPARIVPIVGVAGCSGPGLLAAPGLRAERRGGDRARVPSPIGLRKVRR